MFVCDWKIGTETVQSELAIHFSYTLMMEHE